MGTQRAKAPMGATVKKDKYAQAKAGPAASPGKTALAEKTDRAQTETLPARAEKKPAGKNHRQVADIVDRQRFYAAPEAIALLKKTSFVRFDPTAEAHIKLGVDAAKNEQQVRALLNLPHGTGKTLKVLVFSREVVPGATLSGDETLVGKIESGALRPGRDFQAVVATPDLMPKIARLGKILGPKGLMPNPRAGTVSNEPEKVLAKLKKGQLELKNELNAPLVHTAFGKLSFSSAALLENLQAVYQAVKNAKPAKTKGEYLQSLTISSTMGPGIKIDLGSLK